MKRIQNDNGQNQRLMLVLLTTDMTTKILFMKVMLFMKVIHLMIFLVPMMMATMNTVGMKMNTMEMKMKNMVMMMILWSKAHQGTYLMP